MNSVFMSRVMTIFVLLFLRLSLRYGTKKDGIATHFCWLRIGVYPDAMPCRRCFLVDRRLDFFNSFNEKKNFY